jgi:hypothetical protein
VDTTQVERIARALCEHDRVPGVMPTWERADPILQAKYRSEARTIIEILPSLGSLELAATRVLLDRATAERDRIRAERDDIAAALRHHHGFLDDADPAPILYKLWSNEHHAWWAPAARGYVTDENEAGLYTEAAATGWVLQGALNGAVDKGDVIVAHHPKSGS